MHPATNGGKQCLAGASVYKPKTLLGTFMEDSASSELVKAALCHHPKRSQALMTGCGTAGQLSPAASIGATAVLALLHNLIAPVPQAHQGQREHAQHLSTCLDNSHPV